jgi:hypothetical protein
VSQASKAQAAMPVPMASGPASPFKLTRAPAPAPRCRAWHRLGKPLAFVLIL